jgi:hypothetical protein
MTISGEVGRDDTGEGRARASQQALVNHAPADHGPAGFDPSRDETPAPFWLIMPEQNRAIRFSFDHGNYSISFRVFDAAEGWREGDAVGSWSLWDGCNDRDFADWENADWDIHGDLKWDGCINWETNPNCMAHGCSPNYSRDLHLIFNTIYAAGGWFYDFLGDEPPKMPDGVFHLRDSDENGEADETARLGPKGDSAAPQGDRPKGTAQ